MKKDWIYTKTDGRRESLRLQNVSSRLRYGRAILISRIKESFAMRNKVWATQSNFLRFCTMDTTKTTVFVQCHSDLIEIAQTVPMQAEFYETGSELPDYDFHCPLMSLPRAFKYRPDSQKTTKPYLHPCRTKKRDV